MSWLVPWKGKSVSYMPEEEDDQVRHAKIYLFKRAIGLHGVFNHWGLLFKFSDTCCVLIEGVNEGGVLRSSYRKNPSDVLANGSLHELHPSCILRPHNWLETLCPLLLFCTWGRRIQLPDLTAGVRISPRGAREFAKNHHLNGKPYFLGSTDCQNWVLEAANDLSRYYKGLYCFDPLSSVIEV